jgi:hypothetical protein
VPAGHHKADATYLRVGGDGIGGISDTDIDVIARLVAA